MWLTKEVGGPNVGLHGTTLLFTYCTVFVILHWYFDYRLIDLFIDNYFKNLKILMGMYEFIFYIITKQTFDCRRYINLPRNINYVIGVYAGCQKSVLAIFSGFYASFRAKIKNFVFQIPLLQRTSLFVFFTTTKQ